MKIIMNYESYPDPFHAGDGLVVSVMMSKYWNKTWGGEIITYHDTEPEDIVSAFPGRIYVSHGTPWVRIQQPNIKAVADKLGKVVKLNDKITLPIKNLKTLVSKADEINKLINLDPKEAVMSFVQGQIASAINTGISYVRSFFKF